MKKWRYKEKQVLYLRGIDTETSKVIVGARNIVHHIRGPNECLLPFHPLAGAQTSSISFVAREQQMK